MKCISKKNKCCHIILIEGRECCGLLKVKGKAVFINSLGTINDRTCPVELYKRKKQRNSIRPLTCKIQIDAKKTVSVYKQYSKKLEELIYWLSGEKGEFPIRKEGMGNYYWRIEMRKRFNDAKKILSKANL